MCGPVYDYSFEDFLNDASQEEWDEWESEASRLELPLDYYIQEFVGQLDQWHKGGCNAPLVRAILRLFLRDSPMFDEMWQEIQDAPGEIFDIPELRDEEDFNLNEYLNANYDY